MKLKIYSLALILLFSTKTFSQVPSWQWLIGAGGTRDDIAISTALDPNGNIYTTGYSDSPTITFDTITLTNVTFGQSSFFIAKYDPTGHVVWARSAGGSFAGGNVVVDVNGNSYVTGSFYSDSLIFGNDTLLNAGAGHPDIFLVKYSSVGNPIWAKRFGGSLWSNYDVGRNISIDGAGNLYLSGYFDSPSIIFGSITLNNPSPSYNYAMFLAKFDPNGNCIWANRAGGQESGSGLIYLSNAVSDLAGNIVVIGNFQDTVYFDTTSLTTPSNSHAIFIAKYDSSGHNLWARKSISTNSDIGVSAAIDNNGNVYALGNFSSQIITFDTTTLTNVGGIDVCLIKYSPNGTVLWAKAAGDAIGNGGFKVVTNSIGDLYFLAYFFGPNIIFGGDSLPDPSSALNNVFLLKCNTNGNLLWSTTVSHSISVDGNDLACDVSGNIIVTGYNELDLTLGIHTLLNPDGFPNLFLAKMDNTNSVENINSFSFLNVFPNPGNGRINFINSDKISEILISDIEGKCVYYSKPESKNCSMEIVEPGIFIARITTNKGVHFRKILVIK